MAKVSEMLRCWVLFCFGILILVASLEVLRIGRRIEETAVEAHATMASMSRAARSVANFAELQTASLQDPKNQKAIDASLQALAVFNGTGRLINREVIPRTMTTLDSMNQAVQSIHDLVQSADKNINAELLPAITETAEQLSVSVESVNKAVVEITQKSNLTLDDIHAIMSDPSWKEALSAIAETSRHAEGTTANIESASKQMPDIAASLEKIAKTTSKYQKAITLVSVLATLARAFLP